MRLFEKESDDGKRSSPLHRRSIEKEVYRCTISGGARSATDIPSCCFETLPVHDQGDVIREHELDRLRSDGRQELCAVGKSQQASYLVRKSPDLSVPEFPVKNRAPGWSTGKVHAPQARYAPRTWVRIPHPELFCFSQIPKSQELNA